MAPAKINRTRRAISGGRNPASFDLTERLVLFYEEVLTAGQLTSGAILSVGERVYFIGEHCPTRRGGYGPDRKFILGIINGTANALRVIFPLVSLVTRLRDALPPLDLPFPGAESIEADDTGQSLPKLTQQ